MTMVFKVADRKRLDHLKPGDKVKFAASSKDGSPTVTAITMARLDLQRKSCLRIDAG